MLNHEERKEMIASAINDGSYTPNRNVFGEKAKTKLIIIERETAMSQITRIAKALHSKKDTREYTILFSNEMSFAEIIEYTNLLNRLQGIKGRCA